MNQLLQKKPLFPLIKKCLILENQSLILENQGIILENRCLILENRELDLDDKPRLFDIPNLSIYNITTMSNIIEKNNLTINSLERLNTAPNSVPANITIHNKPQFVENVKKWVVIDSQLKIVNEKTKKMREIKNEITDGICKYMVDNQLVNNKIGISDGELKIYEKKECSALTFGYVEKCLAELIPDKKQVEYVIQYLKDNRETTNSHDIRRTYNKTEGPKRLSNDLGDATEPRANLQTQKTNV